MGKSYATAMDKNYVMMLHLHVHDKQEVNEMVLSTFFWTWDK